MMTVRKERLDLSKLVERASKAVTKSEPLKPEVRKEKERETERGKDKGKGRGKDNRKAKGKENENPSFSYSKDVKGTEYEGQTMTLGPGEWDSNDDLDIEQADLESQDDIPDLVSDKDVDSDSTSPQEESEDAAAKSSRESKGDDDKHKVHKLNAHMTLFTHRILQGSDGQERSVRIHPDATTIP